MKVDKIIKNAKIFTSEKDKPMASALAVKDGKFVYVGDEAGLAGYEGEVTDLGGKFISPSTSHCRMLTTLLRSGTSTSLWPRLVSASMAEAG